MSDDRRLRMLRSAVMGQWGEWTTHRAIRLYRYLGYKDIRPSIVRHDLAQLTSEGLLVRVDTNPNRRHYIKRTSA